MYYTIYIYNMCVIEIICCVCMSVSVCTYLYKLVLGSLLPQHEASIHLPWPFSSLAVWLGQRLAC